MKFNKIILGLAAIGSLLATNASAQIGFDTFQAVRTLQLATPTLYSGGSAYTSGTNNWVDMRVFYGTVKIDVMAVTNVGNSAATFIIQGSADQTNITAITTAALASSLTLNYTNLIYGSTNLIATNIFYVPGTVTYPNVALGGYATPYLAKALPTNNITATGVSIPGPNNGLVTLGFNVNDVPRYLRLIVLPSGAATNLTVGAVLTGQTGFSTPQY